MKDFKRNIQVYKSYFWDFYNTQPKKVQAKIDWTIGLVRTLKIIPKTYFKHLTGTDGLWEIRVNVGNNIFRVFCFFDEDRVVILLTGFQKKAQKTPKNEIEKAVKLKKEYFDGKEN